MSAPGSAGPGVRRPGGRGVRGAEQKRTGERLIALLIAGGAVLNYPLLSVVHGRGLVAGIPALYVYLFTVWAALAGATALILRERPQPPQAGDDDTGRREP